MFDVCYGFLACLSYRRDILQGGMGLVQLDVSGEHEIRKAEKNAQR
jgi:hypothetical protein